MGIARPSKITKKRSPHGGPRLLRLVDAHACPNGAGAGAGASRLAELLHDALRAQGANTRDMRVIDATARVGAQTLALARRFPDARITALERDEPTSALLTANLALAKLDGLRTNRVRVLCDDLLTCIDRFSDIDVVVIDHTYGGGDPSLELVIDRVRRDLLPHVIGVQVPFTYDASVLTHELRDGGWTVRRELGVGCQLVVASRSLPLC